MDEEKLVQSLHEYERKVLNVLSKSNTLTDIAKASSLKEVEAMRGLQWLENKSIVNLSEDITQLVNLDVNGQRYLSEGLPEKRFLKNIGKDTPVSEITKKANLTKEEVSICLGVLRSKAAISIKKDKELLISILPSGKRLLENQ